MNNLFEELRRRNVFRVAAAYAVVGWLILQVSDIAFPRLGLPDWTITLVLVLLLVGLPVALVLAWAFELTPDGVKKTEEVSESVAAHTGQKLNYLIIASLVIALGYFVWESRFLDAGTTDETDSTAVAEITEKTVAVLPFTSFSGDQDQGWFADGLTEEILNALVRTRDLLVSSRTSSFAYKGSDKDIRAIATELGVAHVLEGSVRRGGDRIRITAQLIRANDGFHLWSETYDRDYADIIDIQEDVAINIAKALQTAMDPDALAAMMDTGTSSVEAYEAYLEGSAVRFDSTLGADEATRQAIAKFEQAAAIDPGFARAHAHLADIWYDSMDITAIGSDLGLKTAERLARGNRYNDLAIAAFGDGAEADMRRGRRAQTDLRFIEAKAIYERVLAAEPDHEGAFSQLIRLNYWIGDRAAAIGMIDRVHEINTIDANFHNLRIQDYVWSFAIEKAAAAADAGRSAYPGNSDIAYQAQRAYLMNGQIEKAARALQVVIGGNLLPQANIMIARIRQACATGDLETAEALYLELPNLPDNEEVTSWLAAQTLGYEDEADSFIRHLDVPDRLVELMFFNHYYHFDVSRYPNLKAVLDAQGIERPAPVPVLFGCQKWRTGENSQ